jgi:DNA (cytosine-5)-methyltransferase 1
MDCFEVNAVNYGAPQLRERAIFIGNRFGRVVDFPNPTHGPAPTRGRHGSQLSLLDERDADPLPFRTLGDAIRNVKEDDPVMMDFSQRKKRYLAMVPPGGNWRCLPTPLQKESMGRAWYAKGGRSGWWRRLSYDLPCPTIVTMPNHAGTALCHPEEVRTLTARECALVQEFPADWEFVGTPNEQYAQVGNAVPIRLGEVAGQVIARYLDELRLQGHSVCRGEAPRFRVVYIRSHVRTRQWYKAGHTFVWEDGQDNHAAAYGEPVTLRRTRTV